MYGDNQFKWEMGVSAMFLNFGSMLLLHSWSLFRYADQGTLIINSSDLNNFYKNITANGQGNMNVDSLTDSNGMIFTGKNVSAAINNLNNGVGKIVVSATLCLTADDLKNIYTVIEQSQSDVNNYPGKITAGDRLILRAHLLNNAQDTISEVSSVKLFLKTITANGSINLEDLSLTIQSDFTNEIGNSWKANRDFSLTTTESIRNSGNVEAGRNVSLTASSITNESTGVISANETLKLNAKANLINTGSAIGNDITANANNISNINETAVIAATNSVNLFAAVSVENKDEAAIYSLGDINIAGGAAQDNNGRYIVSTGYLLNQSATIEAQRGIQISAVSLIKRGRLSTCRRKSELRVI